jgi:hypothetical protein
MMANNLMLLNCDDSIRVYTSSFQENEHIISQKISLHDPVGLQRIKLPCRAFDCDHLQCFDFNVFISMNKDSWDYHNKCTVFKCSICNKRLNPGKVFIDYVALALLKLYPSSDSVQLFRNGALQVNSGHISSEFNSFVINSIYDLKKMGYMNIDRRIVQLAQLQHVSVFDITNVLNTIIDVNEIFSIVFKKSKKQKVAGWCETIEKSRPFYCSTWRGKFCLLMIFISS